MTIEHTDIGKYKGAYLALTVDRRKYLVSVHYICEVIGLWRVENISGGDERIRGLIRYDGEMVPVLHLGRLLGDSADSESIISDIVVLERIVGTKAIRTGLSVDDVGGIYEIGFDELDAIDLEEDGGNEFLPCSVVLKGRDRKIIDIEKLLDETDRITAHLLDNN